MLTRVERQRLNLALTLSLVSILLSVILSATVALTGAADRKALANIVVFNCEAIEALKASHILDAKLTIRQINDLEDNFRSAFGEEPTFDKIRMRTLPRYLVEMNKQLVIHEQKLDLFAPVDCGMLPVG
jgi:uncharacterized membrane protein